MATKHFLYYIPDLNAGVGAKDRIVEILGAPVDGCTLHVHNTQEGPGKSGRGVLVAAVPSWTKPGPGEIERGLKYCADPTRQVWLEGPGYWVGYNTDNRPGPADLVRGNAVIGYTYACPDTGEWMIPLARTYGGSTKFDQRIVYQPDGTIKKVSVDRYRSLCEFAEEHFEALCAVNPEEMTIASDAEYADVACQAICVNYHASRFELSLLGFLTIESAAFVCGLLCDWPAIIEVFQARGKKNESDPDTSTTNSGEVAE